MKITDFDKIWCLSACDKERISDSKKEFESLGWDVEYHFNPQNKLIYDADKSSFQNSTYNRAYSKGKTNVYNNALACFIGHYNIIKTSYMLGYKKILVAEDDFKLKKGVDFDFILEQAPEDFDLLHFYDYIQVKNVGLRLFNGEDDFWKLFLGEYSPRSTVLYAMSKKLMEYYLSWYENNTPEPADYFFNHIQYVKYKIYVTKYNILNCEENKSLIKS